MGDKLTNWDSLLPATYASSDDEDKIVQDIIRFGGAFSTINDKGESVHVRHPKEDD